MEFRGSNDMTVSQSNGEKDTQRRVLCVTGRRQKIFCVMQDLVCKTKPIGKAKGTTWTGGSRILLRLLTVG